MTIILDQQDYLRNHDQISLCIRGEMCKIAEETHISTGRKRYVIDTDVSAGWPSAQDPAEKHFHGPCSFIGDWTRSGLGTFYLIECTDQPDGRYSLRFTDDLNVDMP